MYQISLKNNLNTGSQPIVPALSVRKALAVGVMSLSVALVATAAGIFIACQSSSSPKSPAVIAMKTITCLGKLEPRGEVIKLAAATSSQESLVASIRIDEGQRVTRGQVLAVLDSERRLKANLQQSQAQFLLASAKLAVTRSGAKSGEKDAQKYEIRRLELDRRARLTSQSAVISKLESVYLQASIDCRRYEVLIKQGAVSQSEYDQRVLSLDTTKQNLTEAKSVYQQIESTGDAQTDSAKATLDRISEVRAVDVAASQAEVVQATAAVEQAKAALDQAYIKAPLNGTVMKIYAHAGEKIGENGFADVGSTEEMFALTEVYQSDISRIKTGQRVRLVTEAAPGVSLSGNVYRVGQEIRRQNVVNSDPTANIDDRVVEVRVQLDPASSKAVSALSNAQVAASIEL